MKCSECVNAGQTSRIDFHQVATHLDMESFYGEDGRLHTHNPNTLATFYRCTRGHTWNDVQGATCGVCEPPKQGGW